VDGIVVGVDDSDNSKAALRWALEEGRLRGVPVNAVHAWQPPLASPVVDVGPVPGPMLDVPVVIEKAKEAAEELVERLVQEVADDASGVDLRPAVVEGSPASALVVGSRGLGGFKGLVLGSVSHQMASHAPCPVVIHRTAST
jgi:nucleotide-binding universal stress UspA family protein